MKFISSLLLLLLMSKFSLAQAPSAINYQALARDAQGQPMVNKTIKLRLSILRTNGINILTTLYSEDRSVTTNAHGLFSIQIGNGSLTNVTGDLKSAFAVNDALPRALKADIDLNNNGNYTPLGMQYLASVPFAFKADEAAKAKVADSVMTPFVGFSARRTTGIVDLPVSQGGTVILPFDKEIFDSANVYNPATGEFTIPAKGMYHLQAAITINLSGTLDNNRIALVFLRNGAPALPTGEWNLLQDMLAPINHLFISTTMSLNKGDVIKIRAYAPFKTDVWSLNPASSSFEAHRIH